MLNVTNLVEQSSEHLWYQRCLFLRNIFVDIPDSSLCRSVETVVRIVQHSYNDDNDPLYKMYINNEIARTVMN